MVEEPTINEITPILDEALSHLSEVDRTAVVRRFLQGENFAEIGEALGTSERSSS